MVNNKNLGNSIIIASVFTTFTILWFGYQNMYDTIYVLIGSFIMIYMWLWFMSSMRPVYITKEFDEMKHPVIEIQTILHVCNLEKHYGKEYNQRLVEKCNCGSTLFRIYNEDTPKGTYIQFICVKCNQKATGLEFNWKQKV